MATGLEDRGNESIATARRNEVKPVPKPKADGLYGVVAGAKEKLAESRASAQRSDAVLQGKKPSWAEKVASNVAIPLGAAEGLFEVVDYALGDATGTEDAHYRATSDHFLDKSEVRKRFLSDWAATHGEEAAKKLDLEDREFLKNVTVDQPKLLKDRNFPTTRNLEGGIISDFLGHTVNEGFDKTPLYKASPDFWNSLKNSDSQWYKDLEKGYDNQYEFKRKLDFPTYGTFIEAHKTFTDEIASLVKKDASMMQGWEEDFLAMGAGTIEFLSQIAGLDDDQPGLTPWQQRWDAGKMLTGGLIGTGVSALQLDNDNKIMGIPLPQLARKPAILTAVIGPGLVRALSLGKNTALGRAVAAKRAADPRFDSFMKRAEGARDKVSSTVGASAIGKGVKALGDIPVPGLIRDTSRVVKEGATKSAKYSEDVSGALVQRRVADLAKSGAKGALYWAWSGAPQLGLIHPLVGTLHGTLLKHSGMYKALAEGSRKTFSRSGDKAQTDLELAEQVGQAESTIAAASNEARSTAASFILGLDQINEYGAQTPGGLSVLESPRYLESVQKGEGVLGSGSIAGLPAAQVILPPNANVAPNVGLSARAAELRAEGAPAPAAAPPPPKGGDAFTVLNSSKKVAARVRKLTDESRAQLARAIAEGSHETNPVGFLEFVEKLPIKTKRFNQQYVRDVAQKPKVEALVKTAQASVKRAYNSQYRRDVGAPLPKGAPQPVKPVQAKPARPAEFDTRRYVMEMPDGQVVRVVSEGAQLLENKALTRDIVLEEARVLKGHLIEDISRLASEDARYRRVVKDTLDEAWAEGMPLFDVIKGADAKKTTHWAMDHKASPGVSESPIYGVDVMDRPGVLSVDAGQPRGVQRSKGADFNLQVSDAPPGGGRIPDATKTVGNEWANRARKKEMALLARNFDLIDVATKEFLSPHLPTKPRDANASASISTMKEMFAIKLESENLRMTTDTWKPGGNGEAMMASLYKNYGRSRVDGAINKQRKQHLEEKRSRASKFQQTETTPVARIVDPKFSLTWDGAVLDGTPLATLIKEGSFPREVGGRGEYMARPYKKKDTPLTEREGRNTEMTDHFEQMGREPPEAADDRTGFREDKLSYADQAAKNLTDEMRAEREAPYEKIEKDINTAFDKGWKSESRGGVKQRKATIEAAKEEFSAKRRAREFKEETGIDVGIHDVATAVGYLRKLETDISFRAKVKKGWIPPLEEYLTLSKQGTAELKAAIQNRKGSNTEKRTITVDEMKRATAARKEISKIMRDNKDLFDKKKDSKLSRDALDARTLERSKVLDEVQALWQGVFEKVEPKGKKVVAKPAAPEAVGATVKLPGSGKHMPKDQAKSDSATKFIGRGTDRSSTNAYAKAWGDRANSGSYTAKDVVFVSAEGNRKGRIKFDVEEMTKAVDAGAEFVTDNIANRERPYNLGEREVAKFLEENNYKEAVTLGEKNTGVWRSSGPVKAKVATKKPWYKVEFDKATKLPRKGEGGRSGVMVKLARRVYRNPDIPFEAKQDIWKKMIAGKDPHISPNYGLADKLGGPSKTDGPTLYKNWHENIESYIEGKGTKESLATKAPLEWQDSGKGAKALGEQLANDISRIEKAKDITVDQRLSALNDIKSNILDDLYQGRRKERGIYDYKESNFMSALGEVRLDGKTAVESRIGIAAIKRAAETGRTVAKEVATIMESINDAIDVAKEASLKEPKSRASKAVQQARNVWDNKEISGVTPEFVKLVRDLKTKAEKAKGSKTSLSKTPQILRYTDIVRLEREAFRKNLPIHEQVALSAIAKKVVAANEARFASVGVAHIASEAGVPRKAERARIDTSVSAIRQAMPDLPSKVPAARPAPKPAPKAAPSPAPKAAKVVEQDGYKRVDEAVVPTWVAKDLRKKLIDFTTMQKREGPPQGLSKVQAEAITAGFSDVWTQGLTMLASEKARALVHEKVLSKIEADGVTLTKTFKENLKKQVNEYLSHFKSPFKGRERMAEYSLENPGPQTPSGMLEVALRTLPDDFTFTGDVWNGTINMKDAFFEALGDLKKKGKNKDIDVIQKEAFIELGNQFAAQVQVIAQNKIINGEMSRLGISRTTSPLDAAARIAIHRLLYQEAMPLGMFNRLRKEVTTLDADGAPVKAHSLEPVSMKDIADLMRTNRQYIVDAMKAEILSARFSSDRGYASLTDKQIRRIMLEQDGPLQKIADALDKYEYRSKIEGAKELNSFLKDVVDTEGEFVDTPSADKAKVSTETGMIDRTLNDVLDYTYNETISDKVFNASFNPEYMDSMLFNARLAQDQARWTSQLTSGMKGNITYESLLTNLGNTLGHSLVAGLLTGELPTTFYARVAHENFLYSRFRNDTKGFIEKYTRRYPERISAYNDLSKYGSLEGMDWGSVEASKAGPILARGMEGTLGKAAITPSKHLNAYRNLRRKIYQLEDNGPRVAEAVREHIQLSEELRQMEMGTKIALPTGKKGMTILTKGKVSKSTDGTGFYRGRNELNKAELGQVKASYVMKKVSGRVFNYKDVPRFIRTFRGGGYGAMAAFITPFLSFPYLSIDIPGTKKGIFAAVFGDNLASTNGYTNSPRLTAHRAMRHTNQKLRVLGWGLNMNQFAHPLNNDLDEMTRFNMEAGGATAAMVRSSQQHNTIGVWRWNNANIFEASLILMRNIFAAQSQFAVWTGNKRALSNKNVEYYMRLNAEGKVLEKNDIVRLAGISGNLWMRSIMQAMPKQGNQDKGWWDFKHAMGHVMGSLIGVDDWNAVKTALPMMGADIKDPVWSSFAPMIRDREETDQLNFESMDAQSQMDFMVTNWLKAFSRLYLRQRKISGGDQTNNQARIALAAFKRQMLVPLDAKIKVTRGLEKERLVAIRSMANLSHARLAEAYTNFYRAVSGLESFKRGRTKEEQEGNLNVQRSKREVNNLRKSLEEARSKAVGALRDSKIRTNEAENLR